MSLHLNVMTATKTFMELKFLRRNNKSENEKIKQFWKFIDNEQHDFVCEVQNEEATNSDQKDMNSSSSSQLVSAKSKNVSKESSDIWYKQLCHFIQLGLDKVALAASTSAKSFNKKELYGSPQFADMVDCSYDELNNEIREFEERTKNSSFRCAYEVPEKFRHLIH